MSLSGFVTNRNEKQHKNNIVWSKHHLDLSLIRI
jgi:hypothetical protein